GLFRLAIYKKMLIADQSGDKGSRITRKLRGHKHIQPFTFIGWSGTQGDGTIGRHAYELVKEG
ncbi:MAG: hypothetical protein JRF36_04160, partial [Deltaproteobacteria bacterium]|nr:hypothetical protein [Deltaproteobacteria bacterium]